MKHILIGTAGHVDHGKTALIRALTGIDADRLKEEKSRGITIDLGFAYMELPDGGRASVIDVPGHEKFIKNMLAGAGGIDLVLLVVAADDGVMPQTREHLGILQLLSAKDGIVVITKADLVDEEWLGLVKEDVRGLVSGTFLDGAPLLCVSSHTGLGIEALKLCIFEKINAASGKNHKIPFRIPIDRVFSAEGFGTVVTGTLIEGIMKKGDEVCLYPSGMIGKVRNLQVHSDYVDEAYAGQRVAVNISGLHRDDITRGDVLAPEGTIQNSRMLDVKLSLLADSPRELRSGSRLHFYYGTANVLCKAVLIDINKVSPGEAAFAQLRFSEEVSVKQGDSFVLRFYSPLETIGGGVVLDVNPTKHRRVRAAETIKSLETIEKGGPQDRIRQTIAGMGIAALADVEKRFGADKAAWDEEINGLVQSGRIKIIGMGHVIEESYREALGKKITAALGEYHKEFPLQPGMRKEELRSRVLPDVKPSLFDLLLEIFREQFTISGGRVALAGFAINYSDEEKEMWSAIRSILREGGFSPPSVDEIYDRLGKGSKARKAVGQMVEAMLTEGVIITTEQGMVFDCEDIERAKTVFREIAEGGSGAATLAQFRDKAGTSRKFALSLLEYFDRIGYTKKTGDNRVLKQQG